MKLKLIPLLVASVFLFSCDDNPTGTSANQSIVTSISGNVNFLPPTSMVYEGLILTSTDPELIFSGHFIQGNKMNIDLFSQPQHLRDIDQYLGTASGVTVSDHDARLNDLRLRALDSSFNILGSIVNDNRIGISNNVFEGYFAKSLIYCDRDLELGGSTRIIYNSDTTVINYNANFGEGWNLVTIKVTKLRSFYIEHEYYTGEGPSGNWYFEF